MHEVSLARAVVNTVLDALKDRGIKEQRVTSITLRIGDLAQVDLESLEFAFSFATLETELESCMLIFTTKDAVVMCTTCKQQSPYSMEHFYRCELCGGACELVSGKEFDVVSIELESVGVH